jgi:hypothetical protein
MGPQGKKFPQVVAKFADLWEKTSGTTKILFFISTIRKMMGKDAEDME